MEYNYLVFCLCVMICTKGVFTENIALGKPTVQSSVTLGGTADLAVDGNSNPDFWSGSCIHTLHGKVDQWWMVDLQGIYNITDVWIQNRDSQWSVAFHDFVVEVYMTNPVVCGEKDKIVCNTYPGIAGANVNVHMNCREETVGRYVKIEKLPEYITDPDNDPMIFCEVQVEGSLVDQCPRGSMFTKYEEKRVNSVRQTTTGVSKVDCSRICSGDKTCYGINIRPSDETCQIVSQLVSTLSFIEDQDWDHFTLC